MINESKMKYAHLYSLKQGMVTGKTAGAINYDNYEHWLKTGEIIL